VAEGSKAFVSFSGGNAGIALAYVAKQLGVPCHLFLPSFVSNRIIERMRQFGAHIQVVPTSAEARDTAKRFATSDPTLTLIHPYDDEDLWEGYSTIVGEMKKQLNGMTPSCIVLSVGGGGMLMGMVRGFKKHGWEKVPIVAMETEGAHKLNKSIKAGALVENVMTSIAKTLGAPSVAPKVMEDAVKNFNVISHVQSDASAIEACLKFSDDHAFCVEPSCGVSLSAVYEGILPEIFRSNGQELGDGPVVVLVCGGCDSSVKILKEYAEQLGIEI